MVLFHSHLFYVVMPMPLLQLLKPKSWTASGSVAGQWVGDRLPADERLRLREDKVHNDGRRQWPEDLSPAGTAMGTCVLTLHLLIYLPSVMVLLRVHLLLSPLILVFLFYSGWPGQLLTRETRFWLLTSRTTSSAAHSLVFIGSVSLLYAWKSSWSSAELAQWSDYL
mgnify:CR=1 FL=1